ncbi:MAG: hypothetical protein KBC84_01770 [Proteobacteria bacterium]|nr:hypothetical protein [Pseudomonadota bacterium]
MNSQISSNLPNTQTAVTEGSKSGIAVSSIYYQVTENTKLPAVAIDAPNLKSYALTKITPELYELTMEDAHLAGNHLSLPQFPPENFRGFSVVVAREEKSKVVLKIFVEDGTRLFPFIANNQLWIKVAE